MTIAIGGVKRNWEREAANLSVGQEWKGATGGGGARAGEGRGKEEGGEWE